MLTTEPRRRGPLALIAGLLTLPLALTACSGTANTATTTAAAGTTSAAESAPAGELEDITVGVIPIIDVAPIYLGIDQGFFEDEGLNLKLETAQGGAAIVPGVVAGQYQFGFSNVVSLMLAGSQGIELQGVASGVQSTGEEGADFGGIVVAADSDIASAKDLAGKKVGVNTLKNINTVTTNEAVRQDGGDPAGIEFVELAFPDIPAAVASGDIDAGQVVEPFLTIAKNQGMKVISSNYAATDADLEVALYFTSANYAASNADTVTKFSAAMNKSLDYAQANPDAVRDILATYTTIEADVQAAVTLPKWASTISADSIDKLAELMVTDGLVDSKPDTSTLIPS